MKAQLSFVLKPKSQIPLDQIPHLARHVSCRYAGESSDQSLEIFQPDRGKAPYPLIIYIHTGAFAYGTRRDEDILPVLPALERGYAIASVDYRKSGEVSWPAQIYDVKAAVRYLKLHAEEFKLAPQQFGVWGIASGGYLAAMLGVTNHIPFFDDLSMGNAGVSSSVKAVVLWCSTCGYLNDLDNQLEENGCVNASHSQASSVESVMMGNALSDIKELNRLASPCTYVDEHMSAFLVVHGRQDTVVPYQQSLQFMNAVREKNGGKKAALMLLDGVGHHGDAWYDSSMATDLALDFFDKQLR